MKLFGIKLRPYLLGVGGFLVLYWSAEDIASIWYLNLFLTVSDMWFILGPIVVDP
jgi:hypothetical protein